jgi:hypothetical protein
LFTFTAFCLFALPAFGQLVEEEAVGRLTIGGSIGVVFPSMTEVNRNVDVVNPFLRREEIRSLDHINEALLTGLDIRYRLGQTPKEEPDEAGTFLDRISVGFSWGAVSARTEITDVTRASVRFFSRATTYYPFVLYHLPFLEASQPRLQLVIGGGPIFLKSGLVEWELEDNTTDGVFKVDGDLTELSGTASASGSALGVVLQAGATIMLNTRFSVGMDAGYRRGRISDLTLDDAAGDLCNGTIGGCRFGEGDPNTPDIVRRLGDWGVIDFFLRDPNGEWQGRNRKDPGPNVRTEEDGTGGCADCPAPYYTGGGLDVDSRC